MVHRFYLLFWHLLLAIPVLAETGTSVLTNRNIEDHLNQTKSLVREFEAIQQFAADKDIKVYLFGGAAASFLQYVIDDLKESDKNQVNRINSRFDYQFSHIFRSTQDVDIVVDGPQEAASELQSFLQSRFNYYIEGSSAHIPVWEVRLLRSDIGTKGQPHYKEALLNEQDILNQNTDSQSLGLIEITNTPNVNSILDLKTWGTFNNPFLNDSANGTITFYREPLHTKTSRFIQGDNPEILSVLRFVGKATQLDRTISESSINEIKKIVREFNPRSVSESTYAGRRLIVLGKKLISQTKNLEKTFKILEQTELLPKLKLVGNRETPDTLAWWMNKTPLTSFVVGSGNGKTAEQLGLKVVSHYTKSRASFENITFSSDGHPNAFISREKDSEGNSVRGEAATFGDGFYTASGEKGGSSRTGGYNIRFSIDPAAREGTDFKYINDEHIIILNRAAISIIRDWKFDHVAFFKKMAFNFDKITLKGSSNEWIFEQTEFEKNLRSLTPAEGDAIYKIIKKTQSSWFINPLMDFDDLYLSWLKLPNSAEHPDLLPEIFKKLSDKRQAIRLILDLPHWRLNLVAVFFTAVPYIKETFDKSYLFFDVLNRIDTIDEKKNFIRACIEQMPSTDFFMMSYRFKGDSKWVDQPDFVREMMKSEMGLSLAGLLLGIPGFAQHPELVEELGQIALKTDKTEKVLYSLKAKRILKNLLELPHWKKNTTLESLVEGHGKRRFFIGKTIVTDESLLAALGAGKTLGRSNDTARDFIEDSTARCTLTLSK